MKLFVDECVVKPIRDALVDAGFDLIWAGDQYRGEDDDVLIGVAFREDRLLVTTDRDFGDWVVRKGLPTIGIVYARMDRLEGSLRQVGERIAEIIRNRADLCRDHITVVESQRIRPRKLGEIDS